MAVKTKRAVAQTIGDVFSAVEHAPRHKMPADEMDREVAYQIVHDELMLDGNARLNRATFVGTWMAPLAQRLMAETPARRFAPISSPRSLSSREPPNLLSGEIGAKLRSVPRTRGRAGVG